MKHKILPVVIFMFALCIATNVFAQSGKFFAVTGDQFGSVNWIAFRQLDANESALPKTLYIPAENNEAVYDAVSGRQIIHNNANNVTVSSPQACGCLNSRMVAAIAYDVKNNRLYYTQMLGNELRYLDLNTSQPKAYTVTTQLLKNFANQDGEASVITRMCFGADNFGYALTNDNEHLIRFSTGKQTSITDLGKLIDAKSNGENSVKTQFKSWGGDLIADANGNLYLFAMQRGIFKINPATRVATYLGQIKNIPEDYTINAAMAEGGANVIVGSSTKTTNYYRVNLNTLEATTINKKAEQVYNVSDFANGKLAFDKKSNNAYAKTLDKIAVNVYPNPVSDEKLNIQFSNISKGRYIIQLSSIEGASLLQKEVQIFGSQTENLYIAAISGGTYIVRVLDKKGKSIYSNQIIISK